MTVFMTKVWGFGEPAGPLRFGLRGFRDRACEELQEGDLVVLVGTTGDQTAEKERGRLLGLMEPTTNPVLSLDFDVRKAAHDFDEDGNYRWPFALLNRRAWMLIDRPLLGDVSDRTFGMNSAQGLVPLTESEGNRVLSLRKREVKLLEPSVNANARIHGVQEARRRGAPPPTTTRRGVMHMRRAPAFTYAMEIEGAEVLSFKIGWAFDFHARARAFNHASMPEIGGLFYKPVLSRLWDTAMDAFRMEQRVLTQFDENRIAANHEIIQGVDRNDLEQAWIRLSQPRHL